MNRLEKESKKYFEEFISGEPLTQTTFEEEMPEFVKTLLDQFVFEGHVNADLDDFKTWLKKK